MSPLVWTPDGAGFTATVGKQTVRADPDGNPNPRWLAFGPDFRLIEFDTGTGRASWPSLGEAQAACERAIAPKKRGRTPGRTIRFARYLPAPLVEAARAEALRRDPTGDVVTDGHVIAEWAERGRGVE